VSTVTLRTCLFLGLAAAWLSHAGAPTAEALRPQTAAAPGGGDATPATVIRAYGETLGGVCTAPPGVRLSVGRDSSLPDERVLIVEYPPPTKDPAGRDVQCAADNRDWTAGGAISFQINPEHAMRLSVSFLDRNRVAYTAWTELKGPGWQVVRIPLHEIRPNPFFQPPDANRGAPIDVSDVKFIAFAPQDPLSGRLTIGRFVVSK
jgi:Carbohydrate binding domain (family 11)